METFPKILPMFNSKRIHTNTAHSHTLSKHITIKDKKKLVLTLTITILTNIWKTRNRLQFDDTIIQATNTIINIKNDLKSIIQTHYKQHNIKNTIPDFERNFCINNALCTVKQKTLTLLL